MPILNELGTNLQSTIEHLNKNQGQLHKSGYKDYAAANAELAATLAETVSDFVNYAQSKRRFEELSRKLELSPGPSEQ